MKMLHVCSCIGVQAFIRLSGKDSILGVVLQIFILISGVRDLHMTTYEQNFVYFLGSMISLTSYIQVLPEGNTLYGPSQEIHHLLRNPEFHDLYLQHPCTGQCFEEGEFGTQPRALFLANPI
jgi:hypothetical protein